MPHARWPPWPITASDGSAFSPHPLSIAGYANPAAEWVIIVFMFLAGANFALQYRALARRDFRIVKDDEELRAYTGVVIVASALLAWTIRGGLDAGAPVRTALFQVLSIITTTGYASVDFQLWSDQGKAILLGLMFVGGCAGSAGGGPKVVRHVLLAKFTLQELRRTLHPRAILPVPRGAGVLGKRRGIDAPSAGTARPKERGVSHRGPAACPLQRPPCW